MDEPGCLIPETVEILENRNFCFFDDLDEYIDVNNLRCTACDNRGCNSILKVN